MVTVCLLKFSNIFSHTNTHLHTVTRLKDKKSLPVGERKPIHSLPVPMYNKCMYCMCLACIKAPSHRQTCAHSDKSPPISTMTSVPFPADEGGTVDGRLIERSSSVSSIISAGLSSPFCPIYMLGGEGKPFRSALTIKSPCGVLEKHNWALTEKKGGGPRIVWLQWNWHFHDLVFL